MTGASINSIRRGSSALALALAAGLGSAQPADAGSSMTFTLTIEQLTTEHTLRLPDGSATRAPLSPGTAVVYSGDNPLFTIGQPASPGLQRQAEAGDPADLIAAVQGAPSVSAVKMLERTDSFTFQAKPGEMLSFATMFGQSNDCFYAPKSGAISLFEKDGKPIIGDRAIEIVLYDAGSEVNQVPGVGPDQGPRQDPKMWRQGELEHATVQPVRDTFAYPPVADVIRVTVSAGKSA